MPNVPIYEPGQVSPANLPNVRVSAPADNPLAGLARGPQSVGQVAADIHTREREKAEQTALLKAENEFRALENELLTGPDGAFAKQGKDDFGIHRAAMLEIIQK